VKRRGLEWASLLSVIGPYLFQENNQTIMVDSDSYYNTLQTFLAVELEKDDTCMVSKGLCIVHHGKTKAWCFLEK
jgi:hypothetical protein